MNRLTRLVLRLYPAAWRARYGDEVAALLEGTGADARAIADLLKGGISMRLSSWPFAKLAPALAMLGLMAGFGGSYLITPVYTSWAVVRIQPGRISAATIGESARTALIEHIRQLEAAVRSQTSLASIILDPRLDLYPEYRKTAPSAKVLDRMKENIFVDLVTLPGNPGKPAAAFSIGFTYSDPVKAQQTVEALISAFLEQNMKAALQPGAPAEIMDVLDAATLQAQPVKPNRLSCALTGGISGLFLAAIVALFKRRHTVPTLATLNPTA